MRMLDPKSVFHADVPAVNPLDLRRFWTVQSQRSTDSGVAFSTKAILQVCASESADPVAIWARTTLVAILLQEGHLTPWDNDGGLNDAVFQAAAVFPLPNGLQQFDPSEFLAILPYAS
jgi:hypothetical protein